jgi:hypothetical protein
MSSFRGSLGPPAKRRRSDSIPPLKHETYDDGYSEDGDGDSHRDQVGGGSGPLKEESPR